MTNTGEDSSSLGGGLGGLHSVRPERDLESNWEVDLAKKLEEYLLKICSGEIHPDEDESQLAVNFAEAALLLQGSVQVYSRKVEYLYSLVLRALEFLSQNSKHDQAKDISAQSEGGVSPTDADDDNDLFWCLDDIPVEAKNCIDCSGGNDKPLYQFVKPPANLVVLEGDCFDATGDGTELESYLLATNDQYQDFILLDPCDAVVVEDFLKGDKISKGKSRAYGGSSACKSFQSPTRRSGDSSRKSASGKKQDSRILPSPRMDCPVEVNNHNDGPNPPDFGDFHDMDFGFGNDDTSCRPSDSDNSDDDCDPWKPLNPHEPGNLKIKPFRKAVKASKRINADAAKRASISALFPLAKLYGTISPEFTKMWESRHQARERQEETSLYEKLIHSLVNGARETCSNPDGENENKGHYDGNDDFGGSDFDMPENTCMDEGPPSQNEKHDNNESLEHECPDSHINLEDLCRSHLDALLANITETETQTELAIRVSTWKQRIEHSLEEQELCPAFDIRNYGENILQKLSDEADKEKVLSFSDVVKDQEKYDVARSFTALLQLVNNGEVELKTSGVNPEFIGHTAADPFHVRLLNRAKQSDKKQLQGSRKRVTSPSRRVNTKFENKKAIKERKLSSQVESKFPSKIGGGIRCTPDRKRRRRSRHVEPLNIHSAGRCRVGNSLFAPL